MPFFTFAQSRTRKPERRLDVSAGNPARTEPSEAGSRKNLHCKFYPWPSPTGRTEKKAAMPFFTFAQSRTRKPERRLDVSAGNPARTEPSEAGSRKNLHCKFYPWPSPTGRTNKKIPIIVSDRDHRDRKR